MAKKLLRGALALALLLLLFVLYRLATLDRSQAEEVDGWLAERVVDRLPYLDEPADGPRRPSGASSIAAAPPSDARAIEGWLADREVALEARCVDFDGRPLEGVEVTATQSGLSSSATSDANGLVRIDRNLAWVDWALSFESFLLAKKRRSVWLFDDGQMQVRLVARLEGYSEDERWVEVLLGETVHAGELVLAPAGEISGRVVDAAGAPVAGARVSASSLDERARSLRFARRNFATAPLEATSGADGAFAFENIPAGKIRVCAQDEQQRIADARLVDLRAGEESRDVLLVLPDDGPDALAGIEGRVVGSGGAPAAGANLRGFRGDPASGTASIVAQYRVRADGSFTIPTTEPLTIDAWDEQGTLGCARAADVEPGTRDLVLRLEDPRTMLVEAVDESGAPVSPFTASVIETEMQDVDSGFRISPAVKEFHGEGSFSHGFPSQSSLGKPAGRLALALPPRLFLVRASALGRREETLGPFDRASAPGTLRFVLSPRPVLRGRVVRDGAPLAGARVTVCLPVLVDGRSGGIDKDGFPSRFHAARKVTTDRQGRFSVSPGETSFYLHVAAKGSASSEVGPIRLEPGREAPELEIALSRGGDLEGEVIVDAGVEPAGIIVGVSRGDGFARTQRTDRHGRFRFTRLTPGPWLVREHYTEIAPHRSGSMMREYGPPEEWPTSCAIVEGRTTRLTLDLREPPGEIVRGRLRLGSRPVAGWTVFLSPAEHVFGSFSSFETCALADDGSFTATVRGPGTYRLAISPIEGPSDVCKVLATIEVGEQGAEWSLVRESGTLAGELPVAERRRARHLVVDAEGASVLTRIDADGLGRFRVEHVPAGAGAIVLEPRTGDPGSADPATWRVLARVDVPAGGTAEVGAR